MGGYEWALLALGAARGLRDRSLGRDRGTRDQVGDTRRWWMRRWRSRSDSLESAG